MMYSSMIAHSVTSNFTLMMARSRIKCVTPKIPSITSPVETCHFSHNHTFKVKAMQSEEAERRFPPQDQDIQPGKEYLMNPLPQFSNDNYKPSGRLQGKVALVTGGDSGIGRAICYHFAKEGATIAFTYLKGIEDIDAMDTLKIINEAKVSDCGDPTAIHTDLKYYKNCKKVVEGVIAKYGCIDILVNNPGILYESSLEEITEERLEEVFRTNIFSYFFMSRLAVKHMKNGGSIINTASVGAYTGVPDTLDYASTKGAVVSFTRSLALNMIDKGIRVNGVAPGPVWTPMVAATNTDEQIANFGSQVPMNRAAQPFEIAPSYVFLASEDSSYYTGQVLHPNGGLIING